MCSVQRAFSCVCWWVVSLLPLPFGYAQSAGCIQLTGVVENQLNHQPISARLFAQTPNGQLDVGRSAEQTGAFLVALPCQTTGLFVQQSGYRPQFISLRPVSLKNQMPIAVIVPLLPVDAQNINKPYQQTEQQHIEQVSATHRPKQSQHNQFTIVDALTNKPLPASICFFFTKGGRRHCLTGDDRHPISIDFPESDIVALEISSAGYQPYQGNLIVNEPTGQTQQHTIRLARELTLLSVQLNKPGYRCSLQSSDSRSPVPLLSVPGQAATVASYSLQPGSYTLTITDLSQTVWEVKSVVLTTGLNVVAIDLSKPGLLPFIAAFNPDSLPPIYFEQSSFTLRPASKALLIQTAAYLTQHPSLRLYLVGHTDAEGDERLNQALSENRAKVVSSFLFSQGIAENRMVLSGRGSRDPISPNDSEEHRSRNRRVQLKLVNQ